MNKKIIIPLIAGCALLALCGCGTVAAISIPTIRKNLDKNKINLQNNQTNITPTPTTNSNLETYTNASKGFEIQYPKNWTKDETVQGAHVMLKSPLEGSNDSFHENVNVITEDLGNEDITLEEYTDLSATNLVKAISDLDVVSESEIKLDGRDAYLVVYTGTSNGRELKWRQAWTIKGNTAYLITFTSEEDQYSKYENNVEEIFNTFKVK